MNHIAETLTEASSCLNPEDRRIDRDLLNVCKAMITESRKARGILTEPSKNDLDAAARTWARQLSGFAIAQIAEMYNRAIKEYSDTSKLFGVPDLLAAGQIIERERRQLLNLPSVSPVCKSHDLVEMPREPNDPPLILGWLECTKCPSVIPKMKVTKRNAGYLTVMKKTA